jgi:hypothetical protein
MPRPVLRQDRQGSQPAIQELEKEGKEIHHRKKQASCQRNRSTERGGR